MFYAILAYHVEQTVASWTPQEDAAVMAGLLKVHDRLNREKSLGPSARLGGTGQAVTLRGAGDGVVIDGPFAETKELIAGFWIWRVKSMDEALAWARRIPNPANADGEVELRPVFEAEEFGAEFTPELRAQEDRLRAEIAAKK
jgi:hypothetical protein